ncbi:Mucin 2 precursor [hydrothermal vent metagenome]|uniref:Mucin 2 n=1 Tax=hydrothermal vent metagenome TaxID=652676 RepID=A0A3B1B559_9ZZZZ
MKINHKIRTQLRLQNILFLVLLLSIIGLLGWLSQRYSYQADWTANHRNTLSEASVKLLQRMPGPIHITAFARDSELLPTRHKIHELIDRYEHNKPDIMLHFVDPNTDPDRVRSEGISVNGELIVEYQGRREHIKNLSEETLTNTLQRLLRSGQQKIVFITGHGERKPDGKANQDYNLFIKGLASKGIKASSLSLNDNPEIPADTSVLVIASPQVDYLPGEVNILLNYLKKGGNLLWLHDPGSLHGLDRLAKSLGISFVPGTIVDPTTQMLGISDPSFALVTGYGHHPVVQDFTYMTIYPRAAGLQHFEINHWKASVLLQTVARSWSETSKLEGSIAFDKGSDTPGPLTIGFALTRPQPKTNKTNKKQDAKEKNQRVIVLGDGDFISNTYLGNQGNQDLGYNIVNWLSHDDNFISIPSTTAPDTELVLEKRTWSLLGLVFLIVLPMILLSSGIVIWLKRRKR